MIDSSKFVSVTGGELPSMASLCGGVVDVDCGCVEPSTFNGDFIDQHSKWWRKWWCGWQFFWVRKMFRRILWDILMIKPWHHHQFLIDGKFWLGKVVRICVSPKNLDMARWHFFTMLLLWDYMSGWSFVMVISIYICICIWYNGVISTWGIPQDAKWIFWF